MQFEKRLERAIERGQQTRDARSQKEAELAMTEEDFRTLHGKCRIDLSERIEACLKKLADHFPGFRFETVVGDDGWGAKVSRDDFGGRRRGQMQNEYSRLVMLISPYSSTHIVELTSKATVRNKELFNRAHYQMLEQVDLESFTEMIDLWVLEYAEKYSASG